MCAAGAPQRPLSGCGRRGLPSDPFGRDPRTWISESAAVEGGNTGSAIIGGVTTRSSLPTPANGDREDTPSEGRGPAGTDPQEDVSGECGTTGGGAQLLYDSADSRHPAVAELQELLRYRDLVLLLIGSGIKTRYKRSVLGVLWTLLNPLLHMTVLTLAFSAVFKGAVPDYPVYVLAGLIVWNFFSQGTTASLTAVMSGGNLMRQIYIPPSVFCVATVMAGLVNLGLSLIPLVLIMVIMGHPFTPALLFLPVAVLLLTLFTLGLALGLGTLSVFFTDLVEVYGVLLRAGYFLTAVMYPISIIPERWRWVIEVNPVYSYIRCFRDPIYDGVLPPWRFVLIAVVAGVVALALGWWILARKAREIVYRT